MQMLIFFKSQLVIVRVLVSVIVRVLITIVCSRYCESSRLGCAAAVLTLF